MMRARLSLVIMIAACGGGAGKPDAMIVVTPDAPPAPIDAAPPIDAPPLMFIDAGPKPDATPVFEICDNGLDDDGNGKVDCADPACASLPYCVPAPHTIQEIQDGTVVTGTSAVVSQVFVTAIRVTPAGSVIAFLQEPDGVTSGGHVYPEYAGVQLFVSVAEGMTFPGFPAMQRGDCISLTGTVIEFMKDTELLAPTSFTAEPAGSCGTMPTPFAIPSGAITFDAIASDSDGITMGEQPGASAEIYEGVLVQVSTLTALTAPDMGVFPSTQDAASGSTLFIGNFLFTGGTLTATAGQTFGTITGVYAQRTTYQLLPRDAADLM